jgi:DNA (cytosine-5)-methyltransferase 1
VRSWDEVSFTIQAGGRHAPLHPQAPKMLLVGPDQRAFVSGHEHLYRRLSVRECARIRAFPDEFTFHYKTVAASYKIIGNAVPVELSGVLAAKIKADLAQRNSATTDQAATKAAHPLNSHSVRERMMEIVNG